MGEYKHYQNRVPAGGAFFATSTVLDFVRVFDDPSLANLMAGALLADFRFYNAQLDAFVVMPYHVHLVGRAPTTLNISVFLGRVKSLSARRLAPRLSVEQQRMFGRQIGLNGREFWKDSFRSFPILTPTVQKQKVTYTDWNPVRAGLVELPEQYQWGSARLWAAGHGSSENGLLITDELIEAFCDPAELVIPRKAETTPSPLERAEG